MTSFGTWTDPTSDLIYRGAMPYLLDGLPVGRAVVDLGGANGLSRRFLVGKGITTVDIDASTHPDVVADAMTYRHPEPVDTVLMRYLLHYLDDGRVRQLFAHVLAWHGGDVVVVQFVNERPSLKAVNSADNGTRTWRAPGDLLGLFDGLSGWERRRVNRLDYTVQPEFYRNRLGRPGLAPHKETLLGVHLAAQ